MSDDVFANLEMVSIPSSGKGVAKSGKGKRGHLQAVGDDFDASSHFNDEEEKKSIESLYKDYLLSDESNLYIYTTKSGVAIIKKWDGYKHVSLDLDTLKSFAEAFVSKYPSKYSNSKVESCVKLTESILRNSSKNLKKSDEFCLLVKNGCIKWQDKKFIFSQKNKNIFCPYFVNVELHHLEFGEQYEPESDDFILTKTRFGSVMSNLLEPDVLSVCQEFMADTISGRRSDMFPFIVGKKGTGKSVVLSCIERFHVDITNIDLSELKGFNLENATKTSFMMIDEGEDKLDVKNFKRLFGGAGMSVDRKFKSKVDFKASETRAFGSINKMPYYSDASGAVESRIVPFPVREDAKSFRGMKEEITDLGASIFDGYYFYKDGERKFSHSEANYVVDFMLNGIQRVIMRGKVPSRQDWPKSMTKQIDDIKETNNSIFSFLSQFVSVKRNDVQKYTPVDTLYEWYNEYCIKSGLNPLKRSNFKNSIIEEFQSIYSKKITISRPRNPHAKDLRPECFDFYFTKGKNIEEDIKDIDMSSVVEDLINPPY